ncbi:tRNA pseudouridine synthase-like 1 isoform X1 [Musca domestica]|uniref:tRNA pseudouridine synthase n=1 Tax=Musca domestica TaxID=7370 RepID=A0ABM3V975_MUSDO|nr:tRNA pseudouridine synthase-like 1 isoform X1 [Musca domestica]
MFRYLLEFSYIGTGFRGIQKTIIKSDPSFVDLKSVQGCLDVALQVFRPVNEIQTVISSRTDAGVHALHSTLHVDLQRADGSPYVEETITGVLNRTLYKQGLPIRLINTRIVPDTFHCRYSALGRTYLYRIAVAKNGIKDLDTQNKHFESFIPVEELDRCHFLHKATFDVERMRQASRMFVGRHDFRTFKSQDRQKSASRDHPMFTVRRIDEINIKPGRSACTGVNAKLAEELYDYWDIEVKGKSFLYKQVRRIVGSLIALATDRINEKCIYEMLTIPSKHNWDPRLQIAPAYGLYLARVHYNEEDLRVDNK